MDWCRTRQGSMEKEFGKHALPVLGGVEQVKQDPAVALDAKRK